MVSVEDVVRRIGNMPIGNPADMRRHAQLFQAEAEAIAQRARRVTATINSPGYECPAADRLRASANGSEAQLLAAANRLASLADDLMRCAHTVEQEQGWWTQEFERIERELAKAVKR